MPQFFEHWGDVILKTQDAKRRMTTFLDQLANTQDLNGELMFLLVGVYANIIQTIGDVATMLHIQQTNASTLCTKAQQLKLLERKRNEKDVRVVNLVLTALGESKVLGIFDQVEDTINVLQKNDETRDDYLKINEGLQAYYRLLNRFEEENQMK